MGINNLPEFEILYKDERAALIDKDNKVCIGVSRKIADNLNSVDVQNFLFPIWKQQVMFQKKIEQKRKRINTAYLMVTRKCNMNCEFCAIRANEKLESDEMDFTDIMDNVIPFLKRNRPHKIIITGGEPLLKHNIDKIVKDIRINVDSLITLQSNGLLLDESFVSKLSDNVDEIDFSTKHMVDSEKGIDMLRNNIEMCQKYGLKVLLTFIYERTNRSDLYKVIDIAAKYNTELIVNMVAPVGRALDHSEILSELDRISMNLDVAKYIEKKGYEDKPLFSMFQQRIQVRTSCGAYGKVLAIFPEGNVYMCQCLESSEYCLGNILEDSAEVIEQNLAQKLNDHSIKSTFCVEEKAQCKECEYAFLCGGMCPVSERTKDNNCYFLKKMLDYQLFERNTRDTSKEQLTKYISFLQRIKEEYY